MIRRKVGLAMIAWMSWTVIGAAACAGGEALAEQPLVDQTANPPVKSLVDREVHETVLAAIGGLPELYREPFVLRHLEGWSYARIGETMNLPVDTVETRLVRARRLLRETLKGRL